MSGENHLIESEQMVAKIVSYVAEGGVKARSFSVEDLGGNTDKKTQEVFVDAVKWLIAEGVLRATDAHTFIEGTEPGEIYAMKIVVTSKGFKMLAQKFDGNLTLGQAVREASNGDKSFAKIGDLVGGLLGGFTKSISS